MFEDVEKVKKTFNFRTFHKFLKMFKFARQDGKKPEWIGNNIWNSLLEKWNMSVYRSKCQTTLIVYLIKVAVCTQKDRLVFMNMPYIWYEFFNMYCY